MSYTDLYVKKRTVPSRLLIVLAVVAVTSGLLFYFFTSESVPTRASDRELLRHEVVNVTPREVSIIWQTDQVDTGWIIYGESPENLENIALDTKDNQNAKEKRKYHYARLSNLTPSQTYYYKIISDNAVVTGNEDTAFSFQTPSDEVQSVAASPAYGKVVDASGSPVSDVFVIMYIPNAYPLLSLTKESGEWLIPLQYVVNASNSTYQSVQASQVLTINIFDNERLSSIRATLDNIQPVPQAIILGKNYNFINNEQVLSAQTQTRTNQITNNTPAIRYPEENAIIPGAAPLIRGYGIPGKTVNININFNPAFTATTTVDKNGDWSVIVGKTILPGRYTLTAITEDSNNQKVGLQRNFTLIKSGERVLGESTPSGDLSPSPTQTGSPTSRLSVSPQVSPTLIVVDQTTPTVPVGGFSTATPPPPVSGFDVSSYALLSIGLVIAGLGLVAIF